MGKAVDDVDRMIGGGPGAGLTNFMALAEGADRFEHQIRALENERDERDAQLYLENQRQNQLTDKPASTQKGALAKLNK